MSTSRNFQIIGYISEVRRNSDDSFGHYAPQKSGDKILSTLFVELRSKQLWWFERNGPQRAWHDEEVWPFWRKYGLAGVLWEYLLLPQPIVAEARAHSAAGSAFRSISQ